MASFTVLLKRLFLPWTYYTLSTRQEDSFPEIVNKLLELFFFIEGGKGEGKKIICCWMKIKEKVKTVTWSSTVYNKPLYVWFHISLHTESVRAHTHGRYHCTKGLSNVPESSWAEIRVCVLATYKFTTRIGTSCKEMHFTWGSWGLEKLTNLSKVI